MAAPGKFTSMPAPVGGLNDRDSIVEMKPNEAVILNNWWVLPTYVSIRKGRTPWVTGLPSKVKSLMEYSPTSGVSKLLAVCSGNVYDVTTQGVAGSPIHTGLTEDECQEAMMTTPGGSFLVFVNGVDKMRTYDGSAFAQPTVTGVDSATFVHVASFKSRLFFARKNSLKIYYLPVNSFGGAASELDLGSVFQHGGYVMAVYNWTIDAGDGMDDKLVVITSNGEVAVYTGTDPSSISTWSLTGVFYLGAPVARRCGVKYGGDLIMTTLEGVYPLSSALLSSTINRSAAITDKIQNSVSVAMGDYIDNFGWQVVIYPDNNMLILNIPAGNGGNFQYVQNTITGAWTKFTGWNASCWLSVTDGLYYGDDNSIQKAWQGNLDNTTSITADVLPSFQYFGSLANNKYFTLVKPYLMSSGSPSILYGMNADFVESDPEGVFNYEASPGMNWDSMYWGTMRWGGSILRITSGWHTVGTLANSASLRMQIQNNGAETRFMNWSTVYQTGGLLNY
jgi:hypothetical protein